jgi:nucleoside-diphosphate-sugar epimerase
MLHRAPAIEKITQAIGWQPTRTLEQILDDVVEYVRRAPLPVDAALLES